MTFYAFALFLHIVGALGLAMALGLEGMGLLRLRSASTAEQVREWLSVFAWLPRIAPASLGMVLLSGIYMTATVWGGVAWIGIALAALVLLWVLGAVLTGPRMAAIGRVAATAHGPVSPALHQQLRQPLLWASFQIRTAIFLGIIFLMTVKPGLGGALLTIGVAVILGLASAWPIWSRFGFKKQERSTDTR